MPTAAAVGPPTRSPLARCAMFRYKISLSLGLLVVLVCIQAAFVYWGSLRVYDYAQHSRLANDILAELLELSANKQRLRAWASQRLMGSPDASAQTRTTLLTHMRASATAVQALARRDNALWDRMSRQYLMEQPFGAQRLLTAIDLFDDNIQAIETRLLQFDPLASGSDFGSVWQELNSVFDQSRGRDLRVLLDSAIERQRIVVPVARTATVRGLDTLRIQAIGMAAFTLLTALLLARSLTSRLQRPLDQLLLGIRQLQAGSLDHRVEIDSHDKFGRLAERFNAMAGELQQHRASADATRQQLLIRHQ